MYGAHSHSTISGVSAQKSAAVWKLGIAARSASRVASEWTPGNLGPPVPRTISAGSSPLSHCAAEAAMRSKSACLCVCPGARWSAHDCEVRGDLHRLHAHVAQRARDPSQRHVDLALMDLFRHREPLTGALTTLLHRCSHAAGRSATGSSSIHVYGAPLAPTDGAATTRLPSPRKSMFSARMPALPRTSVSMWKYRCSPPLGVAAVGLSGSSQLILQRCQRRLPVSRQLDDQQPLTSRDAQVGVRCVLPHAAIWLRLAGLVCQPSILGTSEPRVAGTHGIPVALPARLPLL